MSPYSSDIAKKVMSRNLHENIIIYTNTAKKSEKMKESLDAFLDADESLHGDTMLIYGDLYADVKFLSSVWFTTNVENSQEYINKNIYYHYHQNSKYKLYNNCNNKEEFN